MNMKSALVFGASGLTGQHCLMQLLASSKYESVTIFVRKKLAISHPKLVQHEINFDNLASASSAFNIDHVYCCLGTTIKKAGTKSAFKAIDLDLVVQIAKLSKQHAVECFSVISSIGADKGSLSFYTSIKGQMEQALIAIGLNKLIIARPSLLLGERKEQRLLEHISIRLCKALSWLFIGSLAKYKAIDAKSVAKALIVYANKENNGNECVHIVENDELMLTGDH